MPHTNPPTTAATRPPLHTPQRPSIARHLTRSLHQGPPHTPCPPLPPPPRSHATSQAMGPTRTLRQLRIHSATHDCNYQLD